jgi:hypothetical protein
MFLVAATPSPNMVQPGRKFMLSLVGLAFITVLLAGAAFALRAWWAERGCPGEPFPAGPQGLQPDEPTR